MEQQNPDWEDVDQEMEETTQDKEMELEEEKGPA